MGRASIRGKLKLVKQVRDSGLIFGKKLTRSGATQDRLDELRKSLDYYLQWKNDNHEKYEALYNKSRFTTDVRYPYKKTAYAMKYWDANEPDEILYGFMDNAYERRKIAEESERLKLEGKTGGVTRTRYMPDYKNGKNFIFNCDQNHIDLLAEMDSLDDISHQLNKVIMLLKKEIISVEKKMLSMKKLY
jgi:hypothetical protein